MQSLHNRKPNQKQLQRNVVEEKEEEKEENNCTLESQYMQLVMEA